MNTKRHYKRRILQPDSLARSDFRNSKACVLQTPKVATTAFRVYSDVLALPFLWSTQHLSLARNTIDRITDKVERSVR